LQLLDLPPVIPCGKPTVFRLRVRNTSRSAWQLRAGSNVGIHAGVLLWDPDDKCIFLGCAGMFDAEVAVGQAIDLLFRLPALRKSGHYRVVADMKDEQRCWFYQTGSDPLEVELEVRPQTAEP